MKGAASEWELYERMIARLIADQLATGMCVTPNARIVGAISGRSRQIDVLIESRHETDNSRRLIVDAKKRSRKIGIEDVEAFRGLMEDVGATHGYLVRPSGHTKAAEKRAQKAVSIRIVPFDRLEDFDPSSWPRCTDSRCANGRVFWDGYPEISLLTQPVGGEQSSQSKRVEFVHYVGKCDRCRKFHIRCLTCDDLFSVQVEEADTGHQCNCKLPWFWLASIEQDEKGNKSAELHACIGANQVITVNRRSL